jgi:hypothetical protein
VPGKQDLDGLYLVWCDRKAGDETYEHNIRMAALLGLFEREVLRPLDARNPGELDALGNVAAAVLADIRGEA